MTAARSSWLLLPLVLVACARTDHDAGQMPARGGATNTGGTVGTELPGGADAGGSAPVLSCLYPKRGLQPSPPSGKDAASFINLSSPFPIDVAPSTWRDLGATLDLNGDLVSDLIYLDDGDASPQRFRLAMTAAPPNVFDFSEADCAALRALPVGRLLLRDLDADDVPDFIVGTTDGIQAFLNHEPGLVQVLDYGFPAPTERALLINVGVVDLNDDGRVDLVAGFERMESELPLSFDVGVQSFLQQPDGDFRAGVGYSTNNASGEAYTRNAYMGYLAVGRFGRDDHGSAVLVGSGAPTDVRRLGDQTRFDGTAATPVVVPELDEAIFQVFSLPTPDAHTKLLAIGTQHFYVVDLSQDVATIVSKRELQQGGSFSHELGGGAESPLYFLYDYDRDGDPDFFESWGNGRLAYYASHADASFDPPQLLDLNVWGGAENPFLVVGPLSGVVAHPNRNDATAAVYSLLREAPPPP